jgi:hypothetical protein
MKSQDFLPRFCEKPISGATLNKRKPLTVCISAICEHGLIVGAADRMLTFNKGETEFELKATSTGDNFTFKITPVNSAKNVVMMMAGNTSFQSEIALMIIHHIEKRELAGNIRLTVAETVEMYIEIYNQKRAKYVEGVFLKPLGLDTPEFLKQLSSFPTGYAEAITKQMTDFDFSQGVQTIITGIDDEGSHLYSLNENNPTCFDATGYAAIGIGENHAKSQFMLNNYTRIVPQEEALWLVYMAKRKAEIAGGVGKITDLFRIGPKDKKCVLLNHLEPQLTRIYSGYEKRANSSFKTAQKSVKSYLQSLSVSKEKNKRTH